MQRFAQYFLIPFLILFTFQAEARIQWKSPEVVPEKLQKKDRRVIRFSGTTDPGASVRIRKNKIKLFFDSGGTRWANIPQKHKVQFPVIADENGYFAFDLYLPMVAVEIPVQVNSKKKWRTYALNFRVPYSGRAKDFKAIEESFQDQDLGEKYERSEKSYSKKSDEGMVIRDRQGMDEPTHDNTKIEAWGGIGFSYFDASFETSGGTNPTQSSGSSVVIPTFRFGLDWDYSEKALLKVAIRSTSGETDSITGGTDPVTGKDFNWLEMQASGVWFADFLKTQKGRMGLDLGLQLQKIPLFRTRPTFTNYTYFDNNTYNLSVGILYQKRNNRVWNYDLYGRYLYTISTGDAFEMNSSFPLMFEFGGGVKRRLTKGLSMGVFAQLHYFSMDVKYTNVTTTETSMNLMLLTVDGRLIAHF